MPSLRPTCIRSTIITGFLKFAAETYLVVPEWNWTLASMGGRQQLRAKPRQDEWDRFLDKAEGCTAATAGGHWAQVQFESLRRHTERQVYSSRSCDCAAVIRIQHAVRDTNAALARHADHVAARHIPRNSHLAYPVRGTIVVWHVFSCRPRTSWFVATSQQTLLQKRHAGHLRTVQYCWRRLFPARQN